jgi:choline dehydrogenase
MRDPGAIRSVRPETFDYIVVGGGSAGCVLADRLSALPGNKVLLLEAGGKDSHPMVHIPGAMWAMLKRGMNSWIYQTAPQKQLGGRAIPFVAGKVLGGSSSINGMVYCRGDRADYDRWEQLGNRGWSYDDVLPYFRKAENHAGGEDAFHGVAGPLRVTRSQITHPMARAWLAAAAEAGYPLTDDPNGANREGFGPVEFTVSRGRRMSTAVAYLRGARSRANLTIVTGALASRILFDGKTAVGVEYILNRETRRAHADAEVLVSSGCYNSPQLLMLSGVGEPSHLREHGIEPLIDLPGVGQNFQDHVGLGVQVASPLPVSEYRHFSPLPAAWAAGRYLFRRDGPLGAMPLQAAGVVRTHIGTDLTDLKMYCVPLMVDATTGNIVPRHGVTIRLELTRPESRGTVRLASSDPAVLPVVDPNYLAKPNDRARARDAIRRAREILAQPAYAPYRAEEVSPGIEKQSDADLDEYLNSVIDVDMHGAGSCKMGTDDLAVVDNQLKVHGAERLRVIDASIMPEVISGNTNAPTIMIAEKIADAILGFSLTGETRLAA